MGGNARGFSQRFARFRRSEGGFTLTELIIAISILGIVSGVLATAFVVSGRTTTQVGVRYNESHDAQLASAYLATDVQGAAAITPTTCFAGGLDSLVNFSGDAATPAPAAASYPITTYFYGTVGSQNQVVRRSCSGPTQADLTSDSALIYFSASAGPNSPKVFCNGAPGCDPTAPATRTPKTVKMTFTDHNRADNTDDYVYSLTGSRRSQLSPTGSALPRHASLMALGTTGTTLIVTGGTLSVNSAIVVNSDMTHSGGGLDCLGIQIVGSLSPPGSGCVGGPTTKLGSAVPDPFAGLPQCPQAAGCPSGSGPGPNLPSGAPSGPGVYHDVTIDSAVAFPPGIYVITGLLDVKSGANGLNLAGVTLYFACTSYPTPCPPGSQGGSFLFRQGSGTVTLTPVTSGEYAATPQFPGISIFIDRNNVASSYAAPNGRPTPIFTSGTTNAIGAVYALSAQVTVTGGGSFSGGIVSKTFDISGGSGTITIG
jgi:prepilin-type N-terminal cleavage/methylation domain-containing protein